MRFSNIIEQVYHRPWFITAEGYSSIRKVVEAKLRSEQMDLSDFINPREEMEIDGNGIAHIDICGVLGKGMSKIEKSCGNTGYEDIEDDIEKAMDEECQGIFFEINSPGGGVTGNSEIVEIIQNLEIPTMAYAEEMACSAAYNIAASCDKIMASQSSTIGSIGTIIPWVDSTRQWEEEGMSWQPITNQSGDLKGAMMGPGLTEAQKTSLQEYCEDAFQEFKANVLRNRRVADQWMRGQAFFANRALKYNLIDGISTCDKAYSVLVGML